MPWYGLALLSAVAAASTAVLGKLGVEHVPSAAATAMRSIVVAVLTTLIAAASGQLQGLPAWSSRTFMFLGLSGVAAAVSWLAYFRALQVAPVSWVAPLDKLSLPFTVLFAGILLGETVTWQAAAGVALMVIGAVVATR